MRSARGWPQDAVRSKPIDLLPLLREGESYGSRRGVSCFHRRPPTRRTPLRSYTGSTGCHRRPGGQKVAGRVDVAVVDLPASADPRPDVQRHPLSERTTGGARLGRGEPAVHDDQIAAVPAGLVLRQGAELPPRRVADGTGERVVSLLFTGRSSPGPGRPLTVGPFVPGVGDLLPGGQGERAGEPGVDTDRARGGTCSITSSHGSGTNQRPAASCETVTVDGAEPLLSKPGYFARSDQKLVNAT